MERVVLIHYPPGGFDLKETKALAEECGYTVAEVIVYRKRPRSKYFITEGKLRQLKEAVTKHKCTSVIFEPNLKTVQKYNLAKELGVEVIDRFDLILQIFALHAGSQEAKLQVRLAKLYYDLARARERIRLAKLGEQPGFYGLGRYQVDNYIRHVKYMISITRKKLERIRMRRELWRRRRRKLGYPVIALIGYTVAGKTTLFNALSGYSQPTDRPLFTTLSPKCALVDLGNMKTFVIDSVGFIQNLPHELVEAFKSTLEETVACDLGLLVVDISEDAERIFKKVNTCMEVLATVGFRSPLICVANKVDLIDNPETLSDRLYILKRWGFNDIVPVSALKGYGLDLVRFSITEHLRKKIDFYECRAEGK